MKIYTASEAAEAIGCHKSTVTRACERHSIGVESGRQWAITESDLKALRDVIQEKPGNPKFNVGNYFGGTRKRPKKRRKKSA